MSMSRWRFYLRWTASLLNRQRPTPGTCITFSRASAMTPAPKSSSSALRSHKTLTRGRMQLRRASCASTHSQLHRSFFLFFWFGLSTWCWLSLTPRLFYLANQIVSPDSSALNPWNTGFQLVRHLECHGMSCRNFCSGKFQQMETLMVILGL